MAEPVAGHMTLEQQAEHIACASRYLIGGARWSEIRDCALKVLKEVSNKTLERAIFASEAHIVTRFGPAPNVFKDGQEDALRTISHAIRALKDQP